MLKNFFSLSFLPASADAGLLVLRLLFGGGMLVLHGWPKVLGFGSQFHSFPDPLGVTHEISYLLTIGAEFFGAALVVIGCYTRFAAFSLVVTMGVAFFVVHEGALSGKQSGEMAMIYGAAFLVSLVAGGGRYAVDTKTGNG
jgi:putative oxidoreductase